MCIHKKKKNCGLNFIALKHKINDLLLGFFFNLPYILCTENKMC